MRVCQDETKENMASGLKAATRPGPARIGRLKKAVMEASPGVCPERALIWTSYFKDRANLKKPVPVQMAEALSRVLDQKSVAVYDDEIIVGNYSRHRVGGNIFPELHGAAVLLDLARIPFRKTSPLRISAADAARLASILPFWATRFLAARAFPSRLESLKFTADQLAARYYLINETGGISHFLPDYEKLINKGAEGIAEEAAERQRNAAYGGGQWAFYEGVKIAMKGLQRFGERYALLCEKMASRETDTDRARELSEIAETCRRVPGKPARTFREAVQSLFFTQVALNLESLDNSVCPGRMDRYLFPFYRADVEAGRLDREKAKEILSAFSIKMCEIVPVFSGAITRYHGGMFNGQVVCVGGTDEKGLDSSNELSFIFLEIMDELRMRQPNFLARMHGKAPQAYREKVWSVLAAGANSPAVYNDEVIVDNLVRGGLCLADARNYSPVGCVEPACQGKSFSSTDAALVNAPLALELALNEGRCFGSRWRTGVPTAPVSGMRTMGEVKDAYLAQLGHMVERLILDLQAIERANAKFHPTPLTSGLIEGCLEKGVCSTEGGAVYNFSGIQCVGVAEVGDSLAAINRAVFIEKRFSLKELADHLKDDLGDEAVRRYLVSLPKFGNDVPEADIFTAFAADSFSDQLRGRKNTRGGAYVMGLYSVTVHVHFGAATGALPSGRRRGEPFASGVAPGNGRDRKGPTALIKSVNRLDFSRVQNGVNFNLKFDGNTVRGKKGAKLLDSLLGTYFKGGGMQAQVNVISPEVLLEARNNPERHPGLLVRVSGYSAYFNDLTPGMKDEIIRRTSLQGI